MIKIARYLSWINVIGLLITNIVLLVILTLNKDPWSSIYILINLVITIPFIWSGIILKRNIENLNEHQIDKIFKAVVLILVIPSLILPFTYELGGLIICISVLSLGLLGIYKLKNPLSKILILNFIGFLIFAIDSIIILGFK